MKTARHLPSPSAAPRTASRRHILTGLISAAAGCAFAASASAQTTQGPSAFPFSIDGRFNGLGNGEWSDVVPSNFLSTPNASALFLGVGNPPQPTANSALYAALGTNLGGGPISLHLLYDFLPRTNPFVAPGEIFASITFPITLPGHATGDRQNVSVLFQGKQLALKAESGAPFSFFDVFVDLDQDGAGDVLAASLGLFGAADFGPSPLGAIPHLIVELGVGLRIPAGFGTVPGPLPGGGINPATGLYDPDPAFWGAAGGAGDGAPSLLGDPLQPASAASFTINPNGSTTITPTPEPSSALLLLGSLGMLAARRRRASV